MTKSPLEPRTIVERFGRARQRRTTWEAHWQECYDFALPQRDSTLRRARPGERKTDKLFDATAPDAVDQLAASLMAQLTPPWSSWFAFTVGPDADPALHGTLAPDLERMTRIVQAHFDRSNFVVEMHQCYLDLVTVGTARKPPAARIPPSASPRSRLLRSCWRRAQRAAWTRPSAAAG